MEYDDIKKLIKDLTGGLSDIKSKNKTPIKRKVDKKSIKGVIDVSLDSEPKIPKRKFDDKPIIKDYRYWILKLNRNYKSPAMKINQINIAALKMYASLCDTAERYFNKSYTTVAREVSRLRRQGVSYDIYYSIYLIAEAYVLNFYNPLATKSASKSFGFLEKHFGKDFINLIRDRADDLSHNLKDPDQDTREYFNLTANNKVSVWWDPDGYLREKYGFSKKEELAINQISKRNNSLWKNEELVDILFDMYLSTLRAIFDSDQLEGRRLLNIVKPYTTSKTVLDNIFLISEAKIRDQFIFLTSINIDKAEDIVKEFDKGKSYDFIRNFQDTYIKNIKEYKIKHAYKLYFKDNTNKTNLFIKYLETLNDKEKIRILYEHESDENFKKILDKLIKTDDKIFALYFLYNNGLNEEKDDKILFNTIRKENYDDFISLISNNVLSLKLIDKIKELNKLKAKKIEVDNKKIDISRQNLRKTVNLVNEFFDQDEVDYLEEENIIENQEEIKDNENYAYSKTLKKILDDGYIDKGELNDIAIKYGSTLNTYIGKINESLFDFVGDQTLIIEDEKVIIDEFYVDMIKEYVGGN
ncbi:tellurite resistance TerB C-terminal domain-containing protein [uncultured Anaerococcus sp.]|uniref:tellurite resistance TerB C-terminal domain-containing protein n=1 Tax=uncultured Anaerococcus sp. TaxID=293428 RepID=UPI002622CC0A|nr:tellurite resistance TerB C-terminal domain-containing protein [uncultured Anaerococcus sp.]